MNTRRRDMGFWQEGTLRYCKRCGRDEKTLGVGSPVVCQTTMVYGPLWRLLERLSGRESKLCTRSTLQFVPRGLR